VVSGNWRQILSGVGQALRDRRRREGLRAQVDGTARQPGPRIVARRAFSQSACHGAVLLSTARKGHFEVRRWLHHVVVKT
jgi:hypothetical protein